MTNNVTTNNADSLALFLQALNYAAYKHRNQRRKGVDSVPYINHPIQVANVLLNIGEIDNAQILAAALLHDILEDTDTSSAELEQLFGAQVCRYVEAVSDDKTLNKTTRKQLQIEHAPHLSQGAKLIKLADKICNINDIASNPPSNWSVQRRQEYLDWAQQVVSALGHINNALEDHFAQSLHAAKAAIEQS